MTYPSWSLSNSDLSSSKIKRPSLLFISLFFLFFVSIATLSFGDIPLSTVLPHAYLRLTGNTLGWNPLLDERLPRLIVLLCTGASLSLGGAVIQSLFQNPIATPGILGISSGGSLAAILAFTLGVHTFFPLGISFVAVSGCFITLLFLWNLSRQKDLHTASLILTGIAISSLLSAFQSALLYALRENWGLIQILSEWESGSSWDRNWSHVHMQLPLTLLGICIILSHKKELDILSLGEEEAKNIGVHVKKVRRHLFFAVALLTGGSLAALGSLPFYGLVLPHLFRKICGASHKKFLPLLAIFSSILLSLLDLSLRFFSLHFLTIGTFSSLLGGLFFIYLLQKKGGYSSC